MTPGLLVGGGVDTCRHLPAYQESPRPRRRTPVPGHVLTDVHHRGPAMSDPVTYTAVLPASDETMLFVSGLLAAERRRRGTRRGRRALGCYRQAVLVLRWFLDGTRLAQLAGDNRIGRSTAYRYLHEGIDVLAAPAPGLRGALLAARAAGHTHVQVDGTLIRTDRCSVLGPTARADGSGRRVDLWWSGKHGAHGGNIQVVTAPDGWPLWVSGNPYRCCCGAGTPAPTPSTTTSPSSGRRWPNSPTTAGGRARTSYPHRRGRRHARADRMADPSPADLLG